MAATTPSALNWFEIPAHDLDRAQAFYETLLGYPLQRRTFGANTLAVFPSGDGQPGGALIHSPENPAPSTDGAVLYLDAGPSLPATLQRAAGLKARVLLPALELPEGIGFIAHIVDSEGNRIGLHSRPAA